MFSSIKHFEISMLCNCRHLVEKCTFRENCGKKWAHVEEIISFQI